MHVKEMEWKSMGLMGAHRTGEPFQAFPAAEKLITCRQKTSLQIRIPASNTAMS